LMLTGTPTRLFVLSNLMLKEAICCAFVCAKQIQAARKKEMIFFMAKFMPIKLMNYWLASLLLQIEDSHY